MTSDQAPLPRKALRGLIDLLEEIDERYLGEEWGAADFGDIADGFRYVANILEAGFLLGFDADPERPFFRPIVSRARKLLGDNADALYYTAPVRDDLVYIVKGNLAGTVYLSFTVEAGLPRRRIQRRRGGRHQPGELRRRRTGRLRARLRRSAA